jgi:hypothetical protein
MPTFTDLTREVMEMIIEKIAFVDIPYFLMASKFTRVFSPRVGAEHLMKVEQLTSRECSGQQQFTVNSNSSHSRISKYCTTRWTSFLRWANTGLLALSSQLSFTLVAMK